MKTNSKIIFILNILLIVGLFFPVASSAVMNYNQGQREQIKERIEERKDEWQAKWQEIKEEHKKWQEEMQSIRENNINKPIEGKNNPVCDNLEKWIVKIDQVFTDREMKIEEKQTERMDKLNERRENRDQKLEQHRETWEEKWEEHFGLLEEKAQTNEQKQALVEFKESVMEVRASRQAAVDAAISVFRTELDELIADRKALIEDAKNAYIDAYNIAVQNAKQACTNGDDPAQIRETLRAALKTAKDRFNKARQEIERLNLKALVETRQEAFKEALEYFKKAMEEARAELKAALRTETEE